MTHALSCSIYILVIARHNKICDKILYLTWRAFLSASVHDKTLIHQSRTRSEQDICQGSDKDKETQGDVIIRVLWDRHVDAFIDIKLGDSDAYTYKYAPMTALLARWEKIKKDRYGKHCHDQRKHFSPFILSEKREEPLSQVQGWVNGCIAIAVARSYSRMIR